LQTVDLDPNNQTKLLHFARFWNGQLQIWYRTQDNAEPLHTLPEGEYYVELKLLSNSGQKASYGFLVTHFDNKLKLKRITGLQRLKKILIKKRVRGKLNTYAN
jgi:hypothetical protein